MSAEQVIERLIMEYGDAILRMCYLYLKDYHLAEDAAQETFIKAMKHYESFHQKSSEKTWLTRIAINCCKNMMRMNWFRLGRGYLEEDVQVSAANLIENVLERDSMIRAIQNMEIHDRELIILYYYQELSMKERGGTGNWKIGKRDNTTYEQSQKKAQENFDGGRLWNVKKLKE